MTSTIFTVIALVFGLGMAGVSGANLKKEWKDKESRGIYGVFLGIGILIVIGVVIKSIAIGF